MKYEAVFGDQKRFNEQNNEMAEVMLWHDCLGPNFVSIKELSRMNMEGAIPHGSVVLAMRRIIADPKRWTVEDQKAGRLPDVGVIVKETAYKSAYPVELGDGYECKIIGVYKDEVCLQFDDGSMRIDSIKNIEPIESPEEKAARLCNEWCKTAADIFVRHPSCSATESLGGIYKAMLSGDLPVPVKE